MERHPETDSPTLPGWEPKTVCLSTERWSDPLWSDPPLLRPTLVSPTLVGIALMTPNLVCCEYLFDWSRTSGPNYLSIYLSLPPWISFDSLCKHIWLFNPHSHVSHHSISSLIISFNICFWMLNVQQLQNKLFSKDFSKNSTTGFGLVLCYLPNS